MRPRFRGPYPYRRSRSSRRLPLRSTRRFRRRRASLGTPALAFDRCTAPVKLPTWHCPRGGSRAGPWAWTRTDAGRVSGPCEPSSRPTARACHTLGTRSAEAPARFRGRAPAPLHRVSRETIRVVVFHWRTGPGHEDRAIPPSHLCYASDVSLQCQTRVKLNRVFFPRCCVQARSPACGFAR